MTTEYKCPICGVVITAEVEESGYARYDSEQLSDALCLAIGDHMIAVHPDKDEVRYESKHNLMPTTYKGLS